MITRKKRGPPPTGKGELIGVRIQPDQMSSLDAWISYQDDELSRPEAIRRLVELGLADAHRARARSKTASDMAGTASDMAGREIDRMGDPLATDEERQSRKRRLLKGPKEFRDICDKPSKTKG